MEEGTHHVNKSPLDSAGWVSKTFFSWLSDILKIGYKRKLTIDDMYNVTERDSSAYLCNDLERIWEKELRKKKPSLYRAVVKNYWWQILLYSFLCVIEQTCRISLPLQLAHLLRYIDNDVDRITLDEAYVTATSIGVTSIVMGVIHHPFFFGLQRIGMRIRIALCSMIYKKSLKLNHESIGKANAGHVVNLMSNDVVRFDSAFITVPFLYITPIEMAVVYYILHGQIGISNLAGYCFMFIIIVMQTSISKLFSKFRFKIANLTDKRIHLMSEILAGMRVIKVYCWESYFSEIVTSIRRSECIRIFQSAYMKSMAICGPFYSMVKLCICMSFVIYTVLMGGELTSRKLFIVIGMYNVLRLDVGWMLPYAIQQLSEIVVSLNRVQEFLQLDEFVKPIHTKDFIKESFSNNLSSYNEKCPLIDKKTKNKKVTNQQKKSHLKNNLTGNAYGSTDANIIYPKLDHDIMISVQHASTPWRQADMKGKVPILDDLNMSINRGELVAVVGPVGSGKTSLLMALLGELPVMNSDSVILNSSKVAYSSQEPWVFSSSVRQNVLLGNRYTAGLYDRVMTAVSLDKDIALMPEGSATLVGERGMSLSGGQRARLGLARAVYAQPEVILMDDPLSAVDANVGRHLFDEVIKGELRHCTRILVTHQIQFLREVDRIVIINEGKIEFFDTFENMAKRGDDFTKFLEEISENSEKPNEPEKISTLSNSICIEDPHNDPSWYLSSLLTSESLNNQDVSSEMDKKVVSEVVGAGSIGFKMYRQYIGYGTNYLGVFLCLLSNTLLNCSNVFTDWFLAKWTDDQQRRNRMLSSQENSSMYPLLPLPSHGSNTSGYSSTLASNWSSLDSGYDVIDLKYYLTVYCSNIAFLTVLSGLNAVLIYRILINSSKNLHNCMLASILRAPVSFFDKNPVGRILNRFSKDTGQLDEIMPPVFYEFLTCMFSVTSIVLITAIPNPVIIVALIPITVLLAYTRNYYIPTSRELKRIEGATRSPVFTHVSASMTGLNTIRAFQKQKVFEKEFDQHQDQHTEAWFLFISCSRWMALRMDCLCGVFVSVICYACVYYARSLSSGIVGLTLTYSFSMVNLFSWFIRQNIEVENMMTSVERIIGYIKLQPEADLVSSKDNAPAITWPQTGDIRATDVCMRYDNEGPLALHHLNFHIASREKIGIVGRTGAGKSSFISILFRLNEYSGSLFVDGVELTSLGLHDLRSKISIIPQDPVLFVGTLRENLDPFSKYDDSAIWNSLREVQLLNSSGTDTHGLDTRVLEGGSNFSVGQRQLLCLARALLTSNRILVIDEATANVDLRTDELIQKTIRSKFKNCTILTIAHRINTIMDSDRIMVMDKGHIIEFDTPSELLKKKGQFYSLAKRKI